MDWPPSRAHQQADMNSLVKVSLICETRVSSVRSWRQEKYVVLKRCSLLNLWHSKWARLVLPDPIPPVRRIEEQNPRLLKHCWIVLSMPTNSGGSVGNPGLKVGNMMFGFIALGVSGCTSNIKFCSDPINHAKDLSPSFPLEGWKRTIPPEK